MTDTHSRFLGNRALSPETLMMGYGYDPFLSERSLKPPDSYGAISEVHSENRPGASCGERRETGGLLSRHGLVLD